MIAVIKKIIFKINFKKIKKYIDYNNSIFFEGFKLSILNPLQHKKYLIVGKDTILNCSVIFESKEGNVTIGENTFIGGGNIICRSQINIGSHVFIAWGGYIYDHDSHSLDYRDREIDIAAQLADVRNGKNFILSKNWEVVNSKPITIGDNVWVGMGCIILKGVTIGNGAIIGAGSVVTKDIPAWTVAAGNPAKVIREIPDNLRKK